MSVLASALSERGDLAVWFLTDPLGRRLVEERCSAAGVRIRAEAPEDPDGCRAALAAVIQADDWAAIVLDNYFWDAASEGPLRRHGLALVAIDDLANRRHDVDLLVDQNANRTEADYDGLVPDGCRLAIGSRYAMLAPEFTARRAESLAQAAEKEARRTVFVSLGGGDPHRDLLRIVRLLLAAVPHRLTVATGGHIADAEALRELAAGHPDRIDLALDSRRVPEQMLSSRYAVASGGTMMWERAALALPGLCLVVEDNQVDASRWLEERGIHRVFDLRGGWTDEAFVAAVRRMDQMPNASLAEMARRAARLIPGDGSRTVASLIAELVARR